MEAADFDSVLGEIPDLDNLIAKAERGEDKDGMYLLAMMHDFGAGGRVRDLTQAALWYWRSACAGSEMAMNSIGICYHLGRGVPLDMVQALYWYEKAAEEGNMVAVNNIGEIYFEGSSDGVVPRDYVKAVEYFTRAAINDETASQVMLAWCYEHGLGVTQDVEEATRLFEAAAQKGDKNAIAACYERGIGGHERDIAKAAEVYREVLKENDGDLFARLVLDRLQQTGAVAAPPAAVNAWRASDGHGDARTAVAAEWAAFLPDLTVCPICVNPIAPGATVLIEACLHVICADCAVAHVQGAVSAEAAVLPCHVCRLSRAVHGIPVRGSNLSKSTAPPGLRRHPVVERILANAATTMHPEMPRDLETLVTQVRGFADGCVSSAADLRIAREEATRLSDASTEAIRTVFASLRQMLDAREAALVAMVEADRAETQLELEEAELAEKMTWIVLTTTADIAAQSAAADVAGDDGTPTPALVPLAVGRLQALAALEGLAVAPPVPALKKATLEVSDDLGPILRVAGELSYTTVTGPSVPSPQGSS